MWNLKKQNQKRKQIKQTNKFIDTENIQVVTREKGSWRVGQRGTGGKFYNDGEHPGFRGGPFGTAYRCPIIMFYA